MPIKTAKVNNKDDLLNLIRRSTKVHIDSKFGFVMISKKEAYRLASGKFNYHNGCNATLSFDDALYIS